MEVLKCSKCGEENEATKEFFPPNTRKLNGLDSWCRKCRRAYRKALRIPSGVNDPARALEARKIAECIICGDTQAIQLSIDHDHASGHVRGALCTRCNLGLGHFRDRPELLRLASLYLEGKCACGECDVYWGGQPAEAVEC